MKILSASTEVCQIQAYRWDQARLLQACHLDITYLCCRKNLPVDHHLNLLQVPSLPWSTLDMCGQPRHHNPILMATSHRHAHHHPRQSFMMCRSTNIPPTLRMVP